MTFDNDTQILEHLKAMSPGQDEYLTGDIGQDICDQLPDDYTVIYSTKVNLTWVYRDEQQ